MSGKWKKRSSRGSFEDLFSSFGISICAGTLLVCILKAFTRYYFYYIVILLCLVLVVLYVLHKFPVLVEEFITEETGEGEKPSISPLPSPLLGHCCSKKKESFRVRCKKSFSSFRDMNRHYFKRAKQHDDGGEDSTSKQFFRFDEDDENDHMPNIRRRTKSIFDEAPPSEKLQTSQWKLSNFSEFQSIHDAGCIGLYADQPTSEHLTFSNIDEEERDSCVVTDIASASSAIDETNKPPLQISNITQQEELTQEDTVVLAHSDDCQTVACAETGNSVEEAIAGGTKEENNDRLSQNEIFCDEKSSSSLLKAKKGKFRITVQKIMSSRL